jgi:hypothetical protein
MCMKMKSLFLLKISKLITHKAKKKICVFPIAWSSKLGSVGRDFFFFFLTYKYAPSSKITYTCLFLSYYSLLIIWHAVQCFWFQTSKCTRKWRKLLKSETNTETETNFRILSIYYFFFFGIKNVRVDRKHTFFFFGINKSRSLCLASDLIW